jgi:NADPH-dependent curcumin reductase CurA
LSVETVNRRLMVKSWPDGLPGPEHFEMTEAPLPSLADGQVLVRNQWLSIDPYYRQALGPRFVSVPFCHPGEVMMGVTQGVIVQSRDPKAPVGRQVTVMSGNMQDYVAVSGRDVRLLPEAYFGPGGLPLSTALGVAGVPGLTAYSAVFRFAEPKPGETFVVSSASGCVGATAGQLMKLMGLRTVGVAGAPEKLVWTVETARFDACVSYRSPRFAEDLAAACPDGVDINLEHVGGTVLETVLAQMALDGRVIMCGMIDQYDKPVAPPGPNWGVILQKRLTVRGLRVFEYLGLMPAFERFIAPRILDGSIVFSEDILDGLEQAPVQLARVLTGRNFGKSLIRLV